MLGPKDDKDIAAITKKSNHVAAENSVAVTESGYRSQLKTESLSGQKASGQKAEMARDGATGLQQTWWGKVINGAMCACR